MDASKRATSSTTCGCSLNPLKQVKSFGPGWQWKKKFLLGRSLNPLKQVKSFGHDELILIPNRWALIVLIP